ncbi:MAG: thioredoxin domain-containing protein, partial [Thermomicrobiales bacterium]
RQGMPSISRVLEAVHGSYVTKPEDVRANAAQIREFIEQSNQLAETTGTIDDDTREQAVARLSRHFDGAHGGFGSAPKFPQASVLEFLLHAAKRGNERARAMLETTLDQMAAGGMYDQIGGGFHRYAVDAIWLVPHFEKMLYDNAQLARIYHDAYCLTGTSTYRRITTETLDYVLAEMTHSDGGFFATQDADSEGVEGKFYIWSPSEVISVLGETEGTRFNRWFDVTIEGNFEGHSIPHPIVDIETIAGELGGTTEQAQTYLAELREKLYDVRAKRIWPGRDEKIILSWNGMMLRAFAEAARSFDRDDYRDAAIRNATFLLDQLKRSDGRLAHVWTNGSLGQPAFLDDLANFADGLLALYQATFDPQWLEAALAQTQRILDEFSDDDDLGFFDTSTAHERLIARPRELQDGATPSGNAVAAHVLLKIAAMTADEEIVARIYRLTETMSRPMGEQPLGFGRWFAVADALIGPMKEIAIAGAATDSGVDAFAATVARRYEPNAVTGLADPAQP